MIGLFEYGGPTATRTRDQLIKSQLLYQLSYRPWARIKRSTASSERKRIYIFVNSKNSASKLGLHLLQDKFP